MAVVRVRLMTAVGVLVTVALVAVMTAAVVAFVASSTTPAPTPTECRGAAELDFACYERRYTDIVAQSGVEAALADLVRTRESSGFVRAACHQLMHRIGRDAGRRSGIDAFGQGDQRCAAGYYHGVVEAVMAGVGPDRIRAAAGGICDPFRIVALRSIDHYNCAHGMGHGFMEVYDSDVFAALDGCDSLSDGWEREHCAGGVFMENLSALNNPDRPSRYLRSDDPLYPCPDVAPQHKAQCYDKQTPYALHISGDDFGAVFALCAAAPDVAFRPACRQGVGADVAVKANKTVIGDAAKQATVRQLCQLGVDDAARQDCITGAVRALIRDGADRPGDGIDTAALCGSFADPGMRELCMRVRADTLLRYPPGSPEHQHR
jgi:hypothetical protein